MDSVNTSCGSLKFLIIAGAINGDITVIILQRSTGCIFKLKMEILILCWGLNYQSDPQVFGTIGKVFSRPFQWSLNYFSIICGDKVMVF